MREPRIRSLILATLVSVSFLPHAAISQSLHDTCLSAISNGDIATAKSTAEMLLRFTNVSSQSERNSILDCLNGALADEYEYDSRTGRFGTRSQLEAVVAARENAAQRTEDERLETIKAIEEEATRIVAMEAERRRLQNEALLMTIEACEVLFRNDNSAALLNPVCNPIFLELGVPQQ